MSVKTFVQMLNSLVRFDDQQVSVALITAGFVKALFRVMRVAYGHTAFSKGEAAQTDLEKSSLGIVDQGSCVFMHLSYRIHLFTACLSSEDLLLLLTLLVKYTELVEAGRNTEAEDYLFIDVATVLVNACNLGHNNPTSAPASAPASAPTSASAPALVNGVYELFRAVGGIDLLLDVFERVSVRAEASLTHLQKESLNYICLAVGLQCGRGHCLYGKGGYTYIHMCIHVCCAYTCTKQVS
jgi:hypothetical protein